VSLGRDLEQAIATVEESAAKAGRPSLPFEGRITVTTDRGGPLERHVAGWKALGAQYVSLNTMGQGYATVDQHIAALTEAAPIALAG
jgi:hypothetical protein